ncbi:MAG: hypothetical protein HY912_07850 [Desulfomonile tiedjei]|uniref:Terminase n=1 Tax=Desulfomonile tiedjei TaxID=2358 RepID=A0A9D6V0Z4_9BACT|nr:hypothetical protein [Desulfomonile tiedjei]
MTEWTIESAPHEENSLRKSRIRTERLSQALKQIVPTSGDDLFHIQRFIENLKIINKRGELISLIMNRSQEEVFHKLMECREKQVPARFICCKSRQLGISTLIEAFIFALVTRYPYRFGLVVANSIEGGQTIFSMAQRFCGTLDLERATGSAATNSRRIEYPAPHYSKMQIDTAANRNLGRGATFHYVHASEVAFWERPEEPILAINQSVPRHWDTLIFWESTANGVGNLFHRTWIAAERGESDMEPIFLSWKEFPEYSLPAVPGEPLELTPEEEDYSNRYSLNLEQLKWAIYTKKNQCHNSWDKFHQEYPIAARLAFVFTGMPWFDQDVLEDLLEATARPPSHRGYLKFRENSADPEFVEFDKGPLELWKLPEQYLTYSLGMDVGEGVGADYTVIQVVCNESAEVVARYRSNRVRAEAAGVDAFLLGSFYNFGLLGIERNGPGLATLTACERGLADFPQITGYPNLYYHTYTDRKIPEETRRLGWITNKTTKEAMLSRLAQTIESRGLIIYCRSTLLEMQGLVWDPEKKCFRQSYKAPDSKLTHDDEIMALAIANEMRTHNWENRFIAGILPKGGEF